jgi:hypothetical protein
VNLTAHMFRLRAEAIRRVSDLHAPTDMRGGAPACRECYVAYPCPTIRALDGALDPEGN